MFRGSGLYKGAYFRDYPPIPSRPHQVDPNRAPPSLASTFPIFQSNLAAPSSNGEHALSKPSEDVKTRNKAVHERIIAVEDEWQRDVTVIHAFGGPGSGLHTQSKMLTEEFDIVHLSVSSLLSKYEADGDAFQTRKFGQSGDFYPLATSLSIVKSAMQEQVKLGKKAFLVTGVLVNVAAWDGWRNVFPYVSIPFVLFLECPEHIRRERLLTRMHVQMDSLRSNGQTSKLAITRLEEAETNKIEKRLDLFMLETMDLLDIFDELNILREVPAYVTSSHVYKLTRETMDGFSSMLSAGQRETGALDNNADSNDALNHPVTTSFVVLCLIGGKYAGKQTMAKLAQSKYDFVTIQLRELVAKEVKDNPITGKLIGLMERENKPLPSELIVSLLMASFQRIQSANVLAHVESNTRSVTQHCLLPGFPRNVRDWEVLQQQLFRFDISIPVVAYFDCPMRVREARMQCLTEEEWLVVNQSRIEHKFEEEFDDLRQLLNLLTPTNVVRYVDANAPVQTVLARLEVLLIPYAFLMSFTFTPVQDARIISHMRNIVKAEHMAQRSNLPSNGRRRSRARSSVGAQRSSRSMTSPDAKARKSLLNKPSDPVGPAKSPLLPASALSSQETSNNKGCALFILGGPTSGRQSVAEALARLYCFEVLDPAQIVARALAEQKERGNDEKNAKVNMHQETDSTRHRMASLLLNAVKERLRRGSHFFLIVGYPYSLEVVRIWQQTLSLVLDCSHCVYLNCSSEVIAGRLMKIEGRTNIAVQKRRDDERRVEVAQLVSFWKATEPVTTLDPNMESKLMTRGNRTGVIEVLIDSETITTAQICRLLSTQGFPAEFDQLLLRHQRHCVRRLKSDRPVLIVIVGPPGAGVKTVTSRLCNEFDLRWLHSQKLMHAMVSRLSSAHSGSTAGISEAADVAALLQQHHMTVPASLRFKFVTDGLHLHHRHHLHSHHRHGKHRYNHIKLSRGEKKQQKHDETPSLSTTTSDADLAVTRGTVMAKTHHFFVINEIGGSFQSWHEQVHMADLADVALVLELTASEKTREKRLMGHLNTDMIKHTKTREDILKQSKEYHRNIKEFLQYFENQGLVQTIDAEGDEEETYGNVLQAFNAFQWLHNAHSICESIDIHLPSPRVILLCSPHRYMVPSDTQGLSGKQLQATNAGLARTNEVTALMQDLLVNQLYNTYDLVPLNVMDLWERNFLNVKMIANGTLEFTKKGKIVNGSLALNVLRMEIMRFTTTGCRNILLVGFPLLFCVTAHLKEMNVLDRSRAYSDHLVVDYSEKHKQFMTTHTRHASKAAGSSSSGRGSKVQSRRTSTDMSSRRNSNARHRSSTQNSPATRRRSLPGPSQSFVLESLLVSSETDVVTNSSTGVQAVGVDAWRLWETHVAPLVGLRYIIMIDSDLVAEASSSSLQVDNDITKKAIDLLDPGVYRAVSMGGSLIAVKHPRDIDTIINQTSARPSSLFSADFMQDELTSAVPQFVNVVGDNSTFEDIHLLFVLGPLGAGIHTLCQGYAAQYHVSYINLPDLLRHSDVAVQAVIQQAMKDGKNAPFLLSFHMLKKHLRLGKAQGYTHFIVKGFPDSLEALSTFTQRINMNQRQMSFVFVGAGYDVRTERLLARGLPRDSKVNQALRWRAYQKSMLPLITHLNRHDLMIELNGNHSKKETLHNLLMILQASKHGPTSLVRYSYMNLAHVHVVFLVGSQAANCEGMGDTLGQVIQGVHHVSLVGLAQIAVTQHQDNTKQRLKSLRRASSASGVSTPRQSSTAPVITSPSRMSVSNNLEAAAATRRYGLHDSDENDKTASMEEGDDDIVWSFDDQRLHEDYYTSTKGQLMAMLASRIALGVSIPYALLALMLRREILERCSDETSPQRVFVVSGFPNVAAAYQCWFDLFQGPTGVDHKQATSAQVAPHCAFIRLNVTQLATNPAPTASLFHPSAHETEDVVGTWSYLSKLSAQHDDEDDTNSRIELYEINANQEKRLVFDKLTERLQLLLR